jgi:hypothetical protein
MYDNAQGDIYVAKHVHVGVMNSPTSQLPSLVSLDHNQDASKTYLTKKLTRQYAI